MGLAAVIGMGVILVVGFIVVVFTIVTRLSAMSEEKEQRAIENITLPATAEVISTALDGDQFAVTVSEDGALVVYLFDVSTGDITGKTVLREKP